MLKLLYDLVQASHSSWGNLLPMCGLACTVIVFSVIIGLFAGMAVRLVNTVLYALFNKS